MTDTKCLIVTTHYRPLTGGAQAVYDALAAAAPERFAVLTAWQDYTSGAEVAGWRDFDRHAPYKVLRIPAMRPGFLGSSPGLMERACSYVRAKLLKRKILRAVRNAIRETGASAVCVGALDALGWLVRPLQTRTGMPVIIYTHGEEISQQAYNTAAETRRGNALRAADGIIAVSTFTSGLIAEKYAIGHKKIKWLGNGVDLAKFGVNGRAGLREQLSLHEGPLVLAVGRLVPRKGFDRLLEAWPAILAAVPGAQLAIVGKGPLEAVLQEKATRPEMQGSVFLLGHVEDSVLPALYVAADLFAMPNRTMPDGDTEGFGLVFLEAAAAGTPAVGGRAGGAVDAIIDGETGLLVDGHDVTAIADAVAGLLRDDARRNTMAQAARAYAHTQGWSNKAAELAAWCDALCAARAGMEKGGKR